MFIVSSEGKLPAVQISRGFLSTTNSDPRDLLFIWKPLKEEEKETTPILATMGVTSMDVRHDGRRGVEPPTIKPQINRLTSTRILGFGGMVTKPVQVENESESNLVSGRSLKMGLPAIGSEKESIIKKKDIYLRNTMMAPINEERPPITKFTPSLDIYNNKEITSIMKDIITPGCWDDSKKGSIKGIYSLGNFVDKIVCKILKEKKLIDNKGRINQKVFEARVSRIEDEELARDNNFNQSIVSNQLQISDSYANDSSFEAGGKLKQNYGIGRPDRKLGRYNSPNYDSRRQMNSDNGPVLKKKIKMLNSKRNNERGQQDFSFASDPNESLADSKIELGPNETYNEILFETFSQHKLVIAMTTRHRRRWTEKKIKLKYKKKFTILVVDDTIDQLENVKKILGACNIKVDSADSGKKAHRKVKEVADEGFLYHLILMDVHMPDLNGYDSAKIIRQTEDENKYDPANYIVSISADQQEKVAADSKTHRMNDFVQKPLSQPILFKLVEKRAAELGLDLESLKMKRNVN